MKDAIYKILVVLLCITLCLNFVRAFFVPADSPARTVSVYDVLNAVSLIDVDTTEAYDALLQFATLVSQAGDEFFDIFDKASYTTSDNFFISIVRFFAMSFNVFKTSLTSIVAIAYAFARIGIVLVELVKAIYNFLNTIIGIGVRTTAQGFTAPIGGGGVHGGGFGGRR